MPEEKKSLRTAADMVRGSTAICGIIGNPVEHSMSPMLQNLYAGSTGTDLIYVPFKVDASQVEAAVKGAFAMNIQGLNVTVPHKQTVMEYLDGMDDTARDIGAVNTLVRTERGYKGYNTDVPGLLCAMQEADICIQGRSCIIIGAGGAAKAAVYLLAREGAAQIFILNRSFEKAQALADYENKRAGFNLVTALPISQWRSIPKGRYLAIQTTSVGMHPHTENAPVEDEEFYQLIEEAVDVIYTPSETKFMRFVREAGGRAVNGLNMLIYQGVLSYKLWNPGVEVDRKTLRLAGRLIEERLAFQKNGTKIVLIGFMGAGKTRVGIALSEILGCPFLDTDQEIERRTGMSVAEIFEKQGEESFRTLETETLKDILERLKDTGERAVISTGGGLPLRTENQVLLKQFGCSVYLKTSVDELLRRLEGDTTRPLLQGEGVRERVETLLSKREPLYEKAADTELLTDGKTPEKIAEEIASFAKSS